jgi:hypothetical protein
MNRIVVSLLFFYTCAQGAPAFAAIVVSSDDTYAEVQVNMTTNSSYFQNTGTGATAFASLSLIDESQTRTQFAPTFLHGSYFQQRSGGQGTYSLGWYGVTFSVSANSTYSALGNWTNIDGFSHFHIHLFDSTTNTLLFLNEQESDGVPANYFANTLTGNVSNTMSGNVNGTLLTGHTYQWYANTYTQAFSASDLGDRGLGAINLVVEEIVTPEPASLFVWSAVAMVIGGACWWRRSKFGA